ncbi:MAG: EAL domain-containing protein [Pseudomonadales bacterium]
MVDKGLHTPNPGLTALRALRDGIPDLVFYKDMEGVYLGCNQAFCDFVGKTSESDIIGITDYDLFDQQLAVFFREKDLDMLRTNETKQNDEWVTYPDGRKVLLNTFKTPFLDVEGNVIGILGTSRDITERDQVEEALSESNLRFLQMADSVSDAFWLCDVSELENSSIIYVNPAYERIWQCPAEEVYQDSSFWYSRLHVEDRARIETAFMNFLQGKEEYDEVFDIHGPDGALLTIHEKGELIRDSSGKIIRAAGISRDVTEQYQTQAALRASEQALRDSLQRYQLLFDSSHDALFTAAPPSWHFTAANQAALNMFGVSSLAEFITLGSRGISPERQPDGRLSSEKAQKEIATAMCEGLNSFEWNLQTLNGAAFPAEIKLTRMDEGGEAFLHCVARDISARKKTEQEILHQAHFDSLTNLPNRFLSLDRLTNIIWDAQRNKKFAAVMFLDLDDFKKVNDSLGHETGDKLLIESARRLRNTVRAGDTVGRLGGDEFIVLISGLKNTADVSSLAEKILNEFRAVFKVDGRELILSASIGIAIYPNDGDDVKALLRNADTAMYHSKEQGRDCFSYFTEAMNLEVFRRIALEEQMFGALDRNEFRVLYQPKVEIYSGRIIGAEALLRWRNPVLADVFPNEFIPIAECSGLIVALGQFVLTEALSMAAQWQDDFDSCFHMAVNLSPRQMRNVNLVSDVMEALLQSGVRAETLELEITEGVLMGSNTYVNETLGGLSHLGVGIVMDDFGTGYSSLSYLRRYPFDTLKIDRSFVNDISIGRVGRELVNATIAMAHGLGLKVVAEGVETKEQLTHLAAQGCDFAQGYLFSKPVSAEEITRMLENQNKESENNCTAIQNEGALAPV